MLLMQNKELPPSEDLTSDGWYQLQWCLKGCGYKKT